MDFETTPRIYSDLNHTERQLLDLKMLYQLLENESSTAGGTVFYEGLRRR